MIPVCPKCDKAMFILDFRGAETDYCEKCGGLWLDAGELEALLESTGATGDDALLAALNTPGGTSPPGRQTICPRCDRALHEITVPGADSLTLDQCPAGHGLFFDAEELRRLLAAFPEQLGTHKTIEFLNDMLDRGR